MLGKCSHFTFYTSQETNHEDSKGRLRNFV